VADTSDVETAIVARITAGVYPSGSPPSAVGSPIFIARGWPADAKLKERVAATPPVTTISVVPLANMTVMKTRYSEEWEPLPQEAPTLTVAMAGRSATFAGTAQAGLIAGVRANGTGYTYTVQSSDTPATVAAALAAACPGATASGATVACPAATDFVARIGAPTACVKEVTRQQQTYQVTVWAPTTALRDQIGSLLGPALAEDWLVLADGTGGWMKPGAFSIDDRPQEDNLWIRHVRVSVEYGTTVSQTFPPMIFGPNSVQVSCIVPPINQTA
jgi:hypothetical protein